MTETPQSSNTYLEINHPTINENNPFYYAQDVDGWLEKIALKQPNKENKSKNMDKLKKDKCEKKSTSFIKKSNTRGGRYLIKIDIEAQNEHENDQAVSAQYVMTDQYDEVMDAAQSVVREIYRKMLNQ